MNWRAELRREIADAQAQIRKLEAILDQTGDSELLADVVACATQLHYRTWVITGHVARWEMMAKRGGAEGNDQL